MWGGRFASGPDAIMAEINASIDVDRHLYRQDIAASKAHAAMLARQGIISTEDAEKIAHGLDTILSEIEHGKFAFKRELEDIHMNVEARLAELIGPAAGRLHTARSRNDQVATDFRLYLRDAIDEIDRLLATISAALAERALDHAATVMPGFTHLQTAQPVTFGHHLLAYVEMAARDRGRFADARARLNEWPLGAAALAGTSFPLDRDMTAKALGFDRPMANSLDAVSDRDFVLETLAAAAIAAVHLSRFAEEIVLWTSPLVGFLRAVRQVHHRLLDHAAEAQSRRRRAGARQDRPHRRRAQRAADGDEGPAARLSEGHAGGQGRDHGRARRARAVALGHDRHGARHGAGRGAHEEGGRRRATPPRPISPTGWCARWTCRSARPTTCTGRIVAVAAAERSFRCTGSARGDAADRAAHHRGRVRGAVGRPFGQEPHQLRRHGAAKCAGAGQEMAEIAGAGMGVSKWLSPPRPDLLWCG